MHNLSVSNFRLILSLGPKLFKCLNTISGSQVDVYLTRGGLILCIPLRSLTTNGWVPTASPSIFSPSADSADRAVFTVLYDRSWNRSTRYSITCSTGGKRGLTPRPPQNWCHLSKYTWYSFCVAGLQEAISMSIALSESPCTWKSPLIPGMRAASVSD